MLDKRRVLAGLCPALALCWLTSLASGQLRYHQSFESAKPGSSASAQILAISPGWQVENGHLVQSAGEDRYDLAASFPLFLRGRYTISVRIRHESPYIGGGLLFGMGSRASLDFAQMIRFDGPHELLYGSFRQGQFEAAGRLLVPTEVQEGRWLEMSVHVDEGRHTWTARIDGKAVGEDLGLPFGSGYAGVQVSNGRVAFDDFHSEVLADLQSAVRWPQRFALGARGILHVDPARGWLVASRAKPDGSLEQTMVQAFAGDYSALASNSSQRFAALKPAENRIIPFNPAGRARRSIAIRAGLSAVDFDLDEQGRYHLVGASGEIAILDARGQSIARGTPPGTPGAKAACTAIACAPSGAYGLIADRARQLLLPYEIEGENVVFAEPLSGSAELRDLTLGEADAEGWHTLYLSLAGCVEGRRWKPGQKLSNPIGTTQADGLLGRIDPWGLAILEKRTLVVADRAGQRFVYLPLDLRDGKPRPSFDREGTLHLKWSTALPSDSSPSYRIHADDGISPWKPLEARSSGGGTEHFADLPGLAPLSHCELRWKGLSSALPAPEGGYSLDLWAPAPPGRCAFIRLPVLALIYTNMTASPREGEGIAPLLPLSALERELIIIELREAVRGYWINSGMKLWIDLDTQFVADPVTPGGITASGEANGMPLEEEIARRCRVLEKTPTDFAGIAVLEVRREWDAKTSTWRHSGRGGGLTVGPDVRGYGLSWWFSPDYQGANAWLFCHEFHHQLDAMFALVGHPEYWFNHFSPTIGTAARFGEHYDGNAWILRHWPPYLWFALASSASIDQRARPLGEIRTSADADGDGFPDSNPSLPLDEKSFGSSPKLADSDQDGLDDRAEAMLLIHSGIGGVGQTMGEWAARPDPKSEDADRDGLRDGEDPYPLYPLVPEISMATVRIDGALDEDEYDPLLKIADRDFKASIRASWHYDGLALGFVMDRPGRIQIQLDGRDDGWFIGRDNYRITLDARSAKPTLSLQINNCSEPGRWPFETDKLLPSTALRWRCTPLDGGAFRFELLIPKSEKTNFIPEEKNRIGLLFAFSTDATQRETRRWITPFEPHRFVSFELIP